MVPYFAPQSIRPSQLKKWVNRKFNGIGDPYAHVSAFKQVLRAEQIEDFHTQYEGFGLTLEDTAQAWFELLNRSEFTTIEQMLDEFVQEFTKRGIEHNTLPKIQQFKQGKEETLRHAILRFKQYIVECPIQELPMPENDRFHFSSKGLGTRISKRICT